jgi:DNA-binding response OmpR family regulator
MTDVVVVADDDEDILLLVTTRLHRDGFEVVPARNGIEAVARVQERKPRVVVLDVGMPGMDGIEVLGAIRSDPALAGTRVLLLTAKAQESDVRRGFDAGADAYMKKPFSPAALAVRVRELYDGAL